MSFFPETKTRDVLIGPRLYAESRATGFGVWQPTVSQGIVHETIVSQCHKGSWPTPPNSWQDAGGEMSLHRTWQTYPSTATYRSDLLRGEVRMTGVNGYTFGSNPAVDGSLVDLNTFGTSAIARVLPTNPISGLATALGELKKDGLPSLPGSSMRDRVDLARRSGNEFLNIEFGWLPLVNDVRKFADAVKRSRILIDQYIRDSDRQVRRRFTPQPVTLETTTFTGTGRGVGGINMPNSTVTRSVTERYWFSGAFKYHVPVGDDFYSRLRYYEAISNRLYGTRITPEVIWNLAPWSWAVDWFTNAGDVIHNISQLGSDGLVMRYGYAMRHMSVDELGSGRFDISDNRGRHTGLLQLRVGSEFKRRVRANPYGFGIDDTSLSAIQLAILAALGLTRGQRTA